MEALCTALFIGLCRGRWSLLPPLAFCRSRFCSGRLISPENLNSGNLHTMLTSAFSHSELDHLVTNMIGLYFFGTSISGLFGPTFLLKLYLAGALGGSVFFLLHWAYLEGASAAVNAIILLDILLFPKNIYYVNLIIPLPAILMGAFIIVSDLWRIKKISPENLRSGNLHTMLTSAFSHSELDHLVTNMIGLYFFGTSISGSQHWRHFIWKTLKEKNTGRRQSSTLADDNHQRWPTTIINVGRRHMLENMPQWTLDVSRWTTREVEKSGKVKSKP